MGQDRPVVVFVAPAHAMGGTGVVTLAPGRSTAGGERPEATIAS